MLSVFRKTQKPKPDNVHCFQWSNDNVYQTIPFFFFFFLQPHLQVLCAPNFLRMPSGPYKDGPAAPTGFQGTHSIFGQSRQRISVQSLAHHLPLTNDNLPQKSATDFTLLTLNQKSGTSTSSYPFLFSPVTNCLKPVP